MRNLFALIGLLVVVVGGAGWYLGWYKVNVSKNPDGNLQIKTDVDTKKLAGDSSAFFQKVGQMVNEKVQQTGQTGATTTDANAATNTSVTPPQTNNVFPGTPTTPANTNQTILPNLPLPPNYKP